MIRSRLGEGCAAPAGDFDLAADDADLLMARYENLLERRPLLLNSVLLRQDPHNVGYWLRRAAIFKKKREAVRVLETYAAGLKTIDVKRARGKPHVLWIEMARFYEENSQDLGKFFILVKFCQVFDKSFVFKFIMFLVNFIILGENLSLDKF